MISFKFHNNPYPILYVDLLSACNMKCKLCYNKNLSPFTLEVKQFENLVKSIPKPVQFRFLGGEPTIHPHFFDLVRIARENHHVPTVSSNGLMYADNDFMKELSKPKYNNRCCAYSITLNGGLTPRHPAWDGIDNDSNIYKIKFKALENLIKYNINNTILSAIIIKEFNEDIIPQLLNKAQQHNNIKYIKLRSAKTPDDSVQYTTKEMREEIIPKYVDMEQAKVLFSGLNSDDSRCQECCYEIKTSYTQIKHVEFGTENSCNCWKRGYVDFSSGLIYPTFENVNKEYNKEYNNAFTNV